MEKMKLSVVLGVSAVLVSSSVIAQNSPKGETAGNLSYTNGYVIGQSLSKYYQGQDKDSFIDGLLVGLGVKKGNVITSATIKEQKEQWLKQDRLSIQDKASYISGYLVGSKPIAGRPTVNWQVVMQGIFDAQATLDNPYLDEQKVVPIMTEYAKTERAQQHKLAADMARENNKAGQTFLTQNAKEPGVVVLDSGLQYKIIAPGDGRKPTENDFVNLEVIGKKIDGSVFYDSTQSGDKKPVHIQVSGTLDGWQQALVQMPQGAVWALYVPPELAYGAAGWQDKIEPGETVIYQIKLLSIDDK